MSTHRVALADAFITHRQHLWELCFRVTGSVTDADQLLRDSFRRVVEQPGGHRESDWRAHLTHSAVLLAIEALRRRKRRKYTGPWLPSLLETGDAASHGSRHDEGLPRYDMVESASVAFLCALDALDPRERVMFVLCDALGHDPFDAAARAGWS